MKITLKKIPQQVIVITGASSGIGLATARRAAEQGASLVLAARNEEALQELVDELRAADKEVIHVVADVGQEEDVRRIAAAALDRFGRIDTWVNNAGVSIYGKVGEVSLDDARRMFDTNFWGLVVGCRVAVEAMRALGGALINVGSVVSDRAVPLQGFYVASKHAVKGLTDTLRMELEFEQVPIAVTLIKPAAIDTMYIEHARNYLEAEPQHAPPVYAPGVVADAILYAAEHPVRDLYVGGGAKLMAAAGRIAPALSDRLMVRTMFQAQKSDRRREIPEMSSLYGPAEDGREYGLHPGRVFEHSAYTALAKRPFIPGLAALGVGFLLINLASRKRRKRGLILRGARVLYGMG